ncbi:MAG: 1-(5-phosphoribosyl)-5-[(5-phosphoribosylamino)methylideneamino] imidazole-4-carboxamide isomerase [Nitrosopumilales archaeon]|nr:MAG: 1-(5-phosphoribosyl)-5-[(5-phosphoribosylamino)methylideneamino] imidazole-4-carboxamide isomerase [Nitrosopumilales archaeon]
MKIIPAIDLMDGQVVRLVKGDPNNKTIYSNNPLQVAKKWQSAGADMLHIVDLDATLGSGSNLETIKKIVNELKVPVEVAGGLRDESTIFSVSEWAERVVLGTLAFKDKEKVLKIAEKLGKDKAVISVDQIDGTIVVNGWKKSTEIKLIDGVKEFLQMGFSEFLLTSVNRDGTMQGPDLESLRTVCSLENANVIASGGISSLDDIKNVKDVNPYGVILGKALYENKISIEEAKKIS